MLLLGRLLGWRFPQRGPSTLAARLAVCACLLAAVPARSTAAADTQAAAGNRFDHTATREGVAPPISPWRRLRHGSTGNATVTAGSGTKAPNKFCTKSGSAFPSASAAEVACASSSSCPAIYDQKCDGEGSFYMCKAGSVKASSQDSCVYLQLAGAGPTGILQPTSTPTTSSPTPPPDPSLCTSSKPCRNMQTGVCLGKYKPNKYATPKCRDGSAECCACTDPSAPCSSTLLGTCHSKTELWQGGACSSSTTECISVSTNNNNSSQGDWRRDPHGYTNQHIEGGLTLADCKKRCEDGTWPQCKGFTREKKSPDLCPGHCHWASESSQLQDHAEGGSRYALFTLLTAIATDAKGCRLGVMTVGGDLHHRLNITQSYLGWNIMKHLSIGQAKTPLKEHGGDASALCKTFMRKLSNNEPICGAAYVLPCTEQCRKDPACKAALCRAVNGSAYNGTVKCTHTEYYDSVTKYHHIPVTSHETRTYTNSNYTAVLDLCVTPCMHDPAHAHTCCMVPERAAWMFPCCRERHCCPDQLRRRHRAQTALGPHGAQVSVSVAVSVAVEENSASVSVYDALLRCLQNPAKLDAMCLTGSSGH